jgi:hypothetical protein
MTTSIRLSKKIAFFCIAVILSGLVFLVGRYSSGGVGLKSEEGAAWVSAIATAVTAVLTVILARETWYLRAIQQKQIEEIHKEAIRPDVGIRLEHARAGFNLMDVKIENVGRGIARNLRFSFLDRNGDMIEPESDPIAKKFLKLSMFKHGINSLGVGQCLSSFVFSFFELGSELSGDIFSPFLSIKIEFDDVDGRTHSNIFSIDFVQFKGVSSIGNDPSYASAEELKKIREQLQKLIDGRIEVDTFNASDRVQEKVDQERQWQEQRRGFGGNPLV